MRKWSKRTATISKRLTKRNSMKKHILITGSTDGIGKLAAIKLAKDGHKLYLHGRNSKKLAETITEVKAISKNEEVSGFIADFSDLASVRKMAQEISAKISKLDVLINNAGIFKSASPQTKDGFDIRFSVNYFAPVILTKALLPLLNSGNAPRITNLSSAAQAPLDSQTLSGKVDVGMQEAYAQSKLALTMYSVYLTEEYPTIQVVAVNPGSLLNTKMAAEAYGQFWSPADKGADLLYDLAVSEGFQNVSGAYFDTDKGTERGEFAEAHPDAYHSDKIQKLIAVTETLLQR